MMTYIFVWVFYIGDWENTKKRKNFSQPRWKQLNKRTTNENKPIV